MMKVIGFVLMLFIAFAVSAVDLTTKSGKTYKGVEINKISADGVNIFHESGSATIPLPDLPPEFIGSFSKEEKEQLKKSLKELESHERIKEDAEKKRKQRAFMDSISERILENNMKIIQIIDGGALCRSEEHHLASEYSPARIDYGQVIYIQDIPKGLVDGDYLPPNDECRHLEAKYEFSPKHYIGDKDGFSTTCQYCNKTKTNITRGTKDQKEKYPILSTKPFIRIFYIGTYKYTTASGASATVRKYTYSHKKAMESAKASSDQSSAEKTKEPETAQIPSS